jgi:hypothetical protein
MLVQSPTAAILDLRSSGVAWRIRRSPRLDPIEKALEYALVVEFGLMQGEGPSTF